MRKFFSNGKLGLIIFVLTGVVGLILNFDFHFVKSSTLYPTLIPGDLILISKKSEIQVGDLYYLNVYERKLVSRAIGLPKDKISVDSSRPIVNEERAVWRAIDSEDQTERQKLNFEVFQESFQNKTYTIQKHSSHSNQGYVAPLTLSSSEYYFLGDNRDFTEDSRHFGSLTSDQIIGRARWILFSINIELRPRLKIFWKPERTFKSLSAQQ
jgi:signal peptidase I